VTARHEGNFPRALEADDALRSLEPRSDRGEVELFKSFRGRRLQDVIVAAVAHNRDELVDRVKKCNRPRN
jgi:hypothetical protein